MTIEDDVRAVLAKLDEQRDDPDTQDDTGNITPGSGDVEPEIKQVIHVDKYNLPDGSALFRLPSGEGILVPGDTPLDTENELDANSVESVAPTTPQEQVTPVTETPTKLLVADEQPEPTPTSTKRRVTLSFVLVPLGLLFMLAAGAVSYLYLLPLTASATITITPKAKSLHTDTTFTIATNPKTGQVQGRPLEASSFTKSKTVPATGHAHDDATNAAGVITFYNADAQAHTIPAGVTFSAPDGATIVTDSAVTVQAAVLPEVGIAITAASVIQAGSNGNIAAHTIYTRCCGSPFLTATNTSAFSGGQDARSYRFIQRSDIQNAATDLLASLTPQATATLNKEARPGESIVTPLCSPRTQESVPPGTESASVTVSVTQTCTSVAYMQDSLQQVATSTLARNLNLANYQQEGTGQVTVNGSTYQQQTATLNVSLSGVWVYHFTQTQLAALTRHIAGESQQEARATLERVDGVAQVSIHLQHFDFRSSLPTNPQHISIQFFYIVS